MKGNFKIHLSFWERTIGANKTVCDILKNGCKLPFPYTPSNAEFKNNSSALKNSEFVGESIKEMLRAGTAKECLIKPKSFKSTLIVNKR